MALLVALFAFYACVVVCRSRVRVRTLRTLRFLLSFFLFWWVVASLTSGVAFWEVVLSASNWSPHERKEIVCEVYIVASFGFVEPMVLILVCGIFYRKLSKSVAAAPRGSTPPPVGKRRRRKARPPAPLRCKMAGLDPGSGCYLGEKDGALASPALCLWHRAGCDTHSGTRPRVACVRALQQSRRESCS